MSHLPKKNGLFAIISRLNLTLTIVNVRKKVTSHLNAGTIIWTILQTDVYLSKDIFISMQKGFGISVPSKEIGRIG